MYVIHCGTASTREYTTPAAEYSALLMRMLSPFHNTSLLMRTAATHINNNYKGIIENQCKI